MASTDSVAASPADVVGDDRVSGRMQCAAEMLRRGDDVCEIAIATEVPVALLELLRGEVAAQAELDQQCRAMDRYFRRRRWVVLIVAVLEVAAVANVAVGLAALTGHVAGLGLTAALIAAALLMAVYALVKHSRPPTWRGLRRPTNRRGEPR